MRSQDVRFPTGGVVLCVGGIPVVVQVRRPGPDWRVLWGGPGSSFFGHFLPFFDYVFPSLAFDICRPPVKVFKIARTKNMRRFCEIPILNGAR